MHECRWIALFRRAGALQGGELEASSLTYDQVLVAATKGMTVKVVMPLDYSTSGDAILATAAGRCRSFSPSPTHFLAGRWVCGS